MKRSLRMERAVDVEIVRACDSLRDDPSIWLPHTGRKRDRDEWDIEVHAGPLTRTVRCYVGPVWSTPQACWRILSWTVEPERGDLMPADRALPSFEGEIGLEKRATGPVLRVEGTYSPPGGPVGALLDTTATRHVAEATLRRLLDAVGQALEHRGSDDTRTG